MFTHMLNELGDPALMFLNCFKVQTSSKSTDNFAEIVIASIKRFFVALAAYFVRVVQICADAGFSDVWRTSKSSVLSTDA